MNAFDIQRGYPGLFAFLNKEPHQQVPFFAFVVVVDLRLHRGVQKTVRQVQVEHRYAIRLQ